MTFRNVAVGFTSDSWDVKSTQSVPYRLKRGVEATNGQVMAPPDLVATVASASRYGVKRRNSLRAAHGTWQFDTAEIDQAGQGSKADVSCTTADCQHNCR